MAENLQDDSLLIQSYLVSDESNQDKHKVGVPSHMTAKNIDSRKKTENKNAKYEVGRQEGDMYLFEVANGKMCKGNAWQHDKNADPGVCMALCMTKTASMRYFNHATNGDGNCGCVDLTKPQWDREIRDCTKEYNQDNSANVRIYMRTAIPYHTVAERKLCKSHIWFNQKYHRSPAHCMDYVMGQQKDVCAQKYFNYAWHGNGQCGCTTDVAMDCTNENNQLKATDVNIYKIPEEIWYAPPPVYKERWRPPVPVRSVNAPNAPPRRRRSERRRRDLHHQATVIDIPDAGWYVAESYGGKYVWDTGDPENIPVDPEWKKQLKQPANDEWKRNKVAVAQAAHAQEKKAKDLQEKRIYVVLAGYEDQRVLEQNVLTAMEEAGIDTYEWMPTSSNATGDTSTFPTTIEYVLTRRFPPEAQVLLQDRLGRQHELLSSQRRRRRSTPLTDKFRAQLNWVQEQIAILGITVCKRRWKVAKWWDIYQQKPCDEFPGYSWYWPTTTCWEPCPPTIPVRCDATGCCGKDTAECHKKRFSIAVKFIDMMSTVLPSAAQWKVISQAWRISARKARKEIKNFLFEKSREMFNEFKGNIKGQMEAEKGALEETFKEWLWVSATEELTAEVWLAKIEEYKEKAEEWDSTLVDILKEADPTGAAALYDELNSDDKCADVKEKQEDLKTMPEPAEPCLSANGCP